MIQKYYTKSYIKNINLLILLFQYGGEKILKITYIIFMTKIIKVYECYQFKGHIYLV